MLLISTENTAPADHLPEVVRERVLRGLTLHADRGDETIHTGHGVYAVPGCSGDVGYTVNLDVFSDDPRETCSCPDHKRTGSTCKHIVLATIHRAKTRSASRRSRPPKFDGRAVEANLARMGG